MSLTPLVASKSACKVDLRPESGLTPSLENRESIRNGKAAMKALPSAQLALGIDPEAESLSELKERTESHNTLLQLDSTQHQISWIKPNLQFFLKFGAAGLELLERSVRLWKSWGYRCLLDAKFSEMDNLHLLLLALLFEVSGVLSGSHFLLLDVMMMFSFRLKHSMSSLINNKLN